MKKEVEEKFKISAKTKRSFLKLSLILSIIYGIILLFLLPLSYILGVRFPLLPILVCYLVFPATYFLWLALKRYRLMYYIALIIGLISPSLVILLLFYYMGLAWIYYPDGWFWFIPNVIIIFCIIISLPKIAEILYGIVYAIASLVSLLKK